MDYKKKPNTPEQLNNVLCEPVKKWFYQTYPSYSLPQLYGTYEIHCRKNTLIAAPTGSSKTMTSFLSILNELVDSAQKGILEQRTYAIYISPLKALNKDIEVNLLKPLEEISALCPQAQQIKIGVRTGDTTPYQRRKLIENPPHILITTPESLALLLASEKFTSRLPSLDWFIVDEIHSIAQSKRGTQLALLLEQLSTICGEFCRVGLSATVAPLETVAHYLVGERNCTIVDLKNIKNADIQVISPVKDLAQAQFGTIQDAVFAKLHKLIQSHKTVLVFSNTRSATEKYVFGLKSRYPNQYYEIMEEPPFERAALIGAHHGSLSKEHREEMEQKLREGKLKCIICSSSLELGIDIGFVDIVVQLDSPKHVSRLLQRIGRSGHKINKQAKGIIMCTERNELLECSLIAKMARENDIDSVHIIENGYDVLMQYIVGRCPIHFDELFAEVIKSYPFRNMKKAQLLSCVHALSDSHEKLEKVRIYPKVRFEDNLITHSSKSVKQIYVQNVGTISQSGGVSVKINNRTLGFVDEDFVENLRPGDVFVLAGEAYFFRYARGMTIQVGESGSRAPTTPRWRSSAMSLSADVCKNMTKYYSHPIELNTSVQKQIDSLISEQKDFSALPKDILIEHFEDTEQYYVFHSVYGRKVNEALATFFAYVFPKILHTKVLSGVHDYGFYMVLNKQFSFSQIKSRLEKENIHDIFVTAIKQSEHIKRRFRQCASRALLIIRNYRGNTLTVGKQQFKSHFAFNAVRAVNPNHPILQEVEREVFNDVMDVKTAITIIENMCKKVTEISLPFPSPFGSIIVAQSYSDALSQSEMQSYKINMHHMTLAYLSKKTTKYKDVAPKRLDPVSYDDFWQEKEKREYSFREEAKYAVKIVKLDPTIAFELYRLCEGETDGFSASFKHWLKELLNGAIPKAWSDKLVAYLKEKQPLL